MTRYPPGPRDRACGFKLAQQMRQTPLQSFLDWGRTYGDMTHMRVGWIHLYLVNHPDLIHDVLVTKRASFRKAPYQTRVLRTVDGNGLIVSAGEFWQRQRRLVQPTFHPSRLAQYAPEIVACTQRLLARWQVHRVVDIDAEMTQLTLAIIVKILFNADVTEEAAHLGDAVRILALELKRELMATIALPDWLPLPGKRRKRQALRRLDTFLHALIRQRRASGEDTGDFLSILLAAVDTAGDGTGMTDAQVRDEAITLFNAGHDTTAAALSWVWYLLATHPQTVARLQEEVQQVLGDRPATYADVPQLAYTTMVLKESLRLYPPSVALFVRQAIEPVTVGDYCLAKGSWASLMPYVTQRDPRFFSQPDHFDPERFSPERLAEIPPHAYFPFGSGPHVCIGQHFALLEMTLIVATVLQQFRLTLAPDQGPVVPELHLAIRPQGGLRVTLHPRQTPALTGSPSEDELPGTR